MSYSRMLLAGLAPALLSVCLLQLKDRSEPGSDRVLLSPFPPACAAPSLFVEPSPWELKHALNSLMVLQGTAKGKVFSEAEKYLARARSAGEDAGYIKLAESSLSVSRRQFKLAEKQALRALSLDPHNSRFLAQMGRVQLMLEKDDEAKKYFLAAIHSPNPNTDACQVALSGFEAGDCLEEAYEAGTVMIRSNPGLASSYYRTARIARGLGRFKQGQELAKKSLQIDPGRTEAWFTLAEVELALKNWKEALSASAKVLQLSGVKSSRESILILPIRAQAYEGLGDYPNAIKAWTVAAEQMPDSTLPLVRRAACYAKVGDKKAQKRDLEQVKKVELGF